MLDDKVRILGISGSPRKGNTEALVAAALKGAAEIPGVETEMVSLRGKLLPCIDCDKCPVDPPDKYCAIDDKMSEIYPKMVAADGIIIGAPVYFGTVNAQVKMLMDRCRPLGRAGMLLRYKVGGAIAVGGARHGGQEKAIGTIVDYFVLTGMYPVGLWDVLQVGAGGLAWRPGKIEGDEWFCEFTGDKVTGFGQCGQLGRTVAAMSKAVKAGVKQANPDQYLKLWKIDRKKIVPRND